MKRFRPRVLLLLLAVGAVGARADEDKLVDHDLGSKDKSYRVLMPAEVRRGEKLPLVVYLHPSGRLNLDEVRKDWWPIFLKNRCLMILPRSRGKRMWVAGEEQFVVDCIENVQGMYTVDPSRIILMGVSGGGQVALFLADRLPTKFRAVIAVGTNPVVVRGTHSEWFYPNRETLASCPYFVMNHITEGSALQYWRQVRAKLAGTKASLSILAVLSKDASHYAPPPAEFGPWLAEVLAGKQPRALPDDQKLAVAKLFAPAVAELVKALPAAAPATGGKGVTKKGVRYDLTLSIPPGYVRSEREDRADSTGDPLTQIRFEQEKWPVYVRAEASFTRKPMAEVLAAEEAEAKLRGMLYQVYHTGKVTAAGRRWDVKIGSMTFPDRRKDTAGRPRGWMSVLFLHASALVGKTDTRRWLAATVMDYTGKPDPGEMARLFHAAAAVTVAPGTAPATAPVPKN